MAGWVAPGMRLIKKGWEKSYPPADDAIVSVPVHDVSPYLFGLLVTVTVYPLSLSGVVPLS